MTSKGVMEAQEFDKAIFYQVSCACGDPKCNLVAELEVDKWNQMYLNLYKKLGVSVYWKTDSPLKQFWYRIKFALKILFQGYIEVEESHHFNSVEQINDFIKALEEGRGKLKYHGRES